MKTMSIMKKIVKWTLCGALLAAAPQAYAATASDSLTVTVKEQEWEGGLLVSIPIETSSAISDAKAENGREDGVVHTLQGIRRRTTPGTRPLEGLPRGIYIVNGRKVVR